MLKPLTDISTIKKILIFVFLTIILNIIILSKNKIEKSTNKILN